MPESVKTVIIGGGVIGAACAYHLAEAGDGDVLLLERETVACASTAASLAIVETQYLDPDQVALTAYGKKLCDRLHQERDLAFVRNGYLRMGHTDSDLERFHKSVELQHTFGVEGARVVSPGEVDAIVPGLRADDLSGALWGPNDGYVDAVRYTEILLEIARSKGVRVEQGSEVSAVLTDDARVAGVAVGQREIRCQTVINAAGAWARHIGDLVGLTVPVDGYRRQVGIFASNPPLTRPLPFVIDFVPGIAHQGLYFRDDTSARLVAGLHWENFGEWETPEDPEHFDHGMAWSYGGELAEMLLDRYPRAEALAANGGWSGLYPLTPDGNFILGEAPDVAGFFNAAGGGGVGVQTAAGIGAVLRDMIHGCELELIPNAEAFALRRFGASN
jgi:sarcosine oxidase, subunit beta